METQTEQEHKFDIGERIGVDYSTYSYSGSEEGKILSYELKEINPEFCPNMKDLFYEIELKYVEEEGKRKIVWIREQDVFRYKIKQGNKYVEKKEVLKE